MGNIHSHSHMGRNIFIALLLLCAGGSLVVFKTDLLGLSLSSNDAVSHATLIDAVSIKGAFKVEDLGFSNSEIQKINQCVKKHSWTFPAVDVTLNPKDGRMPKQMDGKTPLVMSVVLRTDDAREVMFWDRTIPRDNLVSFMVRSLDEGASEYEHYTDKKGYAWPVKRLYL